MRTTLETFDRVATSSAGEALARWVADAEQLDETPVRCVLAEQDPAALQRLDLALRMLHGQAVSQWCRPAGATTVVVRRWPLPARGIALHRARDEDASTLVLAVGRPDGCADVWRFRFDGASCDLLERGRQLVASC